MKIGLTYTISPDLRDETKHNNYVKWLNLPGQDEIITFKVSESNSKKIEECSGLILSGGIDIHPQYYNSSSLNYCNAPVKGFQKERDEFEIEILQQAFKQNIPVLAICRGLQLVNCSLHGTLVQDLGESLNKIHKPETDDKIHGINIEENSLLYTIVGEKKSLVNSAHHQAIDKLGDGLMISCRADDGTIEGIEWADKSAKAFFIGVQWHPERMFKFNLDTNPITKNIRENFINAAKKIYNYELYN